MVMGQKSSLCPVVAKKSPVWHYLLVCDILWLNKICIFWGIQINIKINKVLLLQKKLRYSLPRKSLITIYKAFLRPLIDYGDIIDDQPQNESL